MNEISVPVKLQIQNLQSLMSELQGKLSNLKVGSTGFKNLQSVISAIGSEIDRLQIQTSKPFMSEAQFKTAERSVEKLEDQIEKLGLSVSRIKFSDLNLTPQQQSDIKGFEDQLESIKANLKMVKDTAKQEFLNTDLGKQWATIDSTAFSKSLSQITANIRSEVNKQEKELERLQAAATSYQNAIAQNKKINDFLQKTNKDPISIGSMGEDLYNQLFDKLKRLKGGKNGGRKLIEEWLQNELELDPEIISKLVKNLHGNDLSAQLTAALQKMIKDNSAVIKANPTADVDFKQKEQEVQNLINILREAGVSEQSIVVAEQALRQQLDNTKQSFSEYQQAAARAAQENMNVDSTTAAFKSQLASLRGTLDQTNAKFLQMQRTTQSFNQMKMAITNFMGFNQVLNITKNAVREAMNHIKELDSVMNGISIVTDMTTDDLWKQVDAYSEMAQNYGVSIKGAYEVSQIYYQQGLETNDVLTLTNETLKLAKISGLDYAQTTDYMTTALRGFKMEMSDASTIVDVYSNLAANTAVSQEELAVAMSKTASSMESVGSTFEDTSAMIATMVAVTRESATNIGSAMKSIASRYGELTKDPTKLVDADGEAMAFNKVDSALQSVGISMKTVDGQFRNFTDVIVELAEKWDQLENTQQRYIATQFAGNRQQSRFLALVSNKDILKANMEVANNSEDVGTLQALKALDSIEVKTEQVRVAYQQFYTTIGMQDVWKTFLDGTKNVINTLNTLPKLFNTIPLGAIGAIANVINLVKGLLTASLSWFAKFLGPIINNAIRNTAEEAEKTAEGIPEGISKAIKKGEDKIANATAEAVGKGTQKGIQQGTQQTTTILNPNQLVGEKKNQYNQNQSLIERLSKGQDNKFMAEGIAVQLMADHKLTDEQYKIITKNNNGAAAGVQQLINKLKEENQMLLTVQQTTEKSTGKFNQFINNLKDGSSKASRNLNSVAMALTTVGMVLSKDTEAGRIASGVFTGLGGALQTGLAGVRVFNGDLSALPQLVMGLINVFNGFSLAIETPAEKLERLNKEAEELSNKAKEVKANYNILDRSVKKLNELKDKQYESEEAAEEYKSVMNEIAEKYPELIQGFDEVGNAIIDVDEAERRLAEARRETAKATYEALEKEREAQKQSLDNSLSTIRNKRIIQDGQHLKDLNKDAQAEKKANSNIVAGYNKYWHYNSDKLKNINNENDTSLVQYLSEMGSDEIIEAIDKYNIQTYSDLKNWFNSLENKENISESENLDQIFSDNHVQLDNYLPNSINFNNVVDFLENLSNFDSSEENIESFNLFKENYNKLEEWQKDMVGGDSIITPLIEDIQTYLQESNKYASTDKLTIQSWLKYSQAEKEGYDWINTSSSSLILLSKKLSELAEGKEYESVDAFMKGDETAKGIVEAYNNFYNGLNEIQKEIYEKYLKDSSSYTTEDLWQRLGEAANKGWQAPTKESDVSKIIEEGMKSTEETKKNIDNYFNEIENVSDQTKELYKSTGSLTISSEFSQLINQALKEVQAAKDTPLATSLSTAYQELFKQINQATPEIRNIIIDTILGGNLLTKEGILDILSKLKQTSPDAGKIVEGSLNSLKELRLANISLLADVLYSDALEMVDKNTKLLSKAEGGLSGADAVALMEEVNSWGIKGLNLTLSDFKIIDDKYWVINNRLTEIQNGLQQRIQNLQIELDDAIKQTEGLISEKGVKQFSENKKAVNLKEKDYLISSGIATEEDFTYDKVSKTTYILLDSIDKINQDLKNKYDKYVQVTDGFNQFAKILTTNRELDNMVSTILSKGFQNINIEDYTGVLFEENDLNSIKEIIKNNDYIGFVTAYAQFAGKTLEETDNLISQAIEKMNAPREKVQKEIDSIVKAKPGDILNLSNIYAQAKAQVIPENYIGNVDLLNRIPVEIEEGYETIYGMSATLSDYLDGVARDFGATFASIDANGNVVDDIDTYAEKILTEAQQAMDDGSSKSLVEIIQEIDKADKNLLLDVVDNQNLTKEGLINSLNERAEILHNRQAAFYDLQQVLPKYGATITDEGILQLHEDANLYGVLQTIYDVAKNGELLLVDDLAQLKDTIDQVLKDFSDTLSKGIEGKLSESEISDLKINAKNLLGIDLSNSDFIKTANGYKIIENTAISLYTQFKEIDEIASKATFETLRKSLSEANKDCETMSEIMASIVNLEKQLGEQPGNKQVKERLALYKQIAQEAQLSDPDSYNFMNQKLPDYLQGPVNYWNSWGKAFTSMNEASESGYMAVEDFYNVVNEMNNLAALSGSAINFLGMELGGNVEDVAKAIERGFGSLTNVDGKGVGVALNKFGSDFSGGAASMVKNVKQGIKTMARSQIEMLDGMIAFLETVVALEDLDKIEDVDQNGIFSFGDIFEVDKNDNPTGNFTKGYQTYANNLIEVAESDEDLKKALKTVKINNITLYDLLEDAKDGVKKVKISYDEYFAILKALNDAAKSGDYDLEHIGESLREVITGTNFNGTIEAGGYTIAVGYGTSVIKNEDGEFVAADGKTYKSSDQALRASVLSHQEKLETVIKQDENGKKHTERVMKINGTTYKVQFKDGKLEYIGPDGKTSYPSQAKVIEAEYKKYKEEHKDDSKNTEINSIEKFAIEMGYSLEVSPKNIEIDEGKVKDALHTQQENLRNLIQKYFSGDGEGKPSEDEIIETAAKVGITINTSLENISEEDYQALLKAAGIEEKSLIMSISAKAPEGEGAEILAELIENDPITKTITVNIEKGTDETGLFEKNGEAVSGDETTPKNSIINSGKPLIIRPLTIDYDISEMVPGLTGEPVDPTDTLPQANVTIDSLIADIEGQIPDLTGTIGQPTYNKAVQALLTSLGLFYNGTNPDTTNITVPKTLTPEQLTSTAILTELMLATGAATKDKEGNIVVNRTLTPEELAAAAFLTAITINTNASTISKDGNITIPESYKASITQIVEGVLNWLKITGTPEITKNSSVTIPENSNVNTTGTPTGKINSVTLTGTANPKGQVSVDRQSATVTGTPTGEVSDVTLSGEANPAGSVSINGKEVNSTGTPISKITEVILQWLNNAPNINSNNIIPDGVPLNLGTYSAVVKINGLDVEWDSATLEQKKEYLIGREEYLQTIISQTEEIINNDKEIESIVKERGKGTTYEGVITEFKNEIEQYKQELQQVQKDLQELNILLPVELEDPSKVEEQTNETQEKAQEVANNNPIEYPSAVKPLPPGTVLIADAGTSDVVYVSAKVTNAPEAVEEAIKEGQATANKEKIELITTTTENKETKETKTISVDASSISSSGINGQLSTLSSNTQAATDKAKELTSSLEKIDSTEIDTSPFKTIETSLEGALAAANQLVNIAWSSLASVFPSSAPSTATVKQSNTQPQKVEEPQAMTLKIDADTKLAEKKLKDTEKSINKTIATMGINAEDRGASSRASGIRNLINQMWAYIQVTVNDRTDNFINKITQALRELTRQTYEVTVKANVTSSGSGKATGNVGIAQAKGTLMGELGPELVVQNGRYFVVGQSGPEFVNLGQDAIVFNHLQTEQLLKHGMSSTRGRAITNERNAVSYATGNADGGVAMASASAVLAELKKIRALWQSLEKASLSDLGQMAGLGSKGTGSKGSGSGVNKGRYNDTIEPGFIADLERWYNLLRQIEKIEKDINYQEKLRNKIQSDRVINGQAFYESQKKDLASLDKEIINMQQLARLQKEYYDKRRKVLEEETNYGKIFTFDENGLMQYNNSAIMGDGTPGGLYALAKLNAQNPDGSSVMSAQNQYALLTAWGFRQDMIYDSSGNKITFGENEEDEESRKKAEDAGYTTAVQTFWDKAEGWKEELDNLYDSYREQQEKILEADTQRNEILKQIVDNQLEVENKIYDAIVNLREAEIEEIQNERDALEETTSKFIDGLNKQLNNEREMYQNQQEGNELNKLRRQLGILQRSGGSASQIRSLQQQINEKERNMYFDKQQQQIDIIEEASQLEIEKLDNQIELMNEQLEYQKAQGLLWNQVYDIMRGTPASINQFITQNGKDWQSYSTTKWEEEYRLLNGQITQWTAYINDTSGYRVTWDGILKTVRDAIAGTDEQAWSTYDEAMHELNGNRTEEEREESYNKYTENYNTTADPNYLEERIDQGASELAPNKSNEVYLTPATSSITGWHYDSEGNFIKDNNDDTVFVPTASKEIVDVRTTSTKQSTTQYVPVDTNFNNAAYQSGYVGTKNDSKVQAQLAKNKVIKPIDNYSYAVRTGAAQNGSNATMSEAEWKKYNKKTKGYSSGGLADYTGLAMVHGSKKKPEAFLNANETKLWKDEVLSGRPGSLTNSLLKLRELINNSMLPISSIVSSQDNGVVIEQAEINMYATIANDYDARRAGENIVDEIMKIARKSSVSSIRR